jgi:hypothetical protein
MAHFHHGLLGDRAIDMDEVLDHDPAFTGIYPTTWEDLADCHLVSARLGGYHLTGDGWLEALKLTGRLKTPEFQDRFGPFGRLNATLKSFIEGRQEEGFEQVHVVAAKAAVSEEWLYNILESRIWENEQNKTGAQFDESKTMVIIPIRFNMPLL